MGESVRAAFLDQAASCEALGSPFMARLMRLLADLLTPEGAVGARVHAWPGDASLRGDVVPLRLAGGLHHLVRSGAAPALAAHYPPHDDDDAALRAALESALSRHAESLLGWLDSAPQTNEVRRSAALLPGLAVAARETGRPLFLAELGASAGLNLIPDRYCLHAGKVTLGDPASPVQLRPDWRGDPPPRLAQPVAGRAGVDLSPLDLSSGDGLERLLAYLWPDQPERADLTRAAATLLCECGVRVERGDALPFLERMLRAHRPGSTLCIFHSIAFQYFPGPSQRRIAAAIEAAGATASADAPIAWLAMEADGSGQAGAALTLRLWPGDRRLRLGRADFHGRWVAFRDHVGANRSA